MEEAQNDPSTQVRRVHRSQESLFAATFRRRGCGLLYDSPSNGRPEVGTGTALRHGGTIFILTCQHVASDFFDGARGLVRFEGIPQFDRSGLTLAFENEDLDLALLKVKPRVAETLTTLSPLVLGDLGTRGDYERAQPDGSWFRIAGFPADQVSTERLAEGKVTYFELCPLTYTTVVLGRTDTTLDLGYHRDAPAAPGMSGGLVFEVPKEIPGEMLAPGRAMAMQHSWMNDASRIMASPIYSLRDEILRLS